MQRNNRRPTNRQAVRNANRCVLSKSLVFFIFVSFVSFFHTQRRTHNFLCEFPHPPVVEFTSELEPAGSELLREVAFVSEERVSEREERDEGQRTSRAAEEPTQPQPCTHALRHAILVMGGRPELHPGSSRAEHTKVQLSSDRLRKKAQKSINIERTEQKRSAIAIFECLGEADVALCSFGLCLHCVVVCGVGGARSDGSLVLTVCACSPSETSLIDFWLFAMRSVQSFR